MSEDRAAYESIGKAHESVGKAYESIGRRYWILGTLGQGGMGTVLLAKDRLDGRVALKRLTPAQEQWDGALRALRNADAPTPQLLTTKGPAGYAPARRAPLDGATLVSMNGAAPSGVLASEALANDASANEALASGLGMASTIWHVADPARPTVVLPTTAVSAGERVAVSEGQSDEQDEALAEMLRLTLAREFRLLSSLRHPNIISVLDYGFDDELRPYFTMELLEGAESILLAGRGKSLEVKVDLIAQTLQALAYLHRRGVIHRDLKPGNVMVVDGRVKVLDFGVSILREREVNDGRFIVGTLAYMAPELLGGAPASEQSDLYAVGVIAHELFSGRYPFDTTSIAALREAVLRASPSLSDVDATVAPIIARLLSKQPEDRPANVDEVIAALGTRTGQPLSVETATTRESFLQAAELVGRDVELAQLSEKLMAAIRGQGSGALVGGESGVGKSRLIDELRARALVDGVVVLRGQALREGGPYHAFRDVIRGLVLRTEPDDHEASVLQAVVPDIDALLDRAVPERLAIDPEAAKTRLFGVVEALLARSREPTLVVVEDLHWAGSESLRLLAEVARIAADLPLLVVGTFRDDERSTLPSELPGMAVLKLRRLDAVGIAALAQSMLGEAGRRPEVLDRLARETEGNPFFLVEVVRALAEDAGALSRVGQEPMPKTLSAGGMHLIVRRRLDQVPRRARPLLEAAAVIGRRIDRPLLERVSPKTNLEAWLETCASVAVLEVDEKSYRFAHDKLREGLLAALSEDACRALHRRVAEAIEAEYPGSPEHTAALTQHWAAAGDKAKEAHYATLAGEQALENSAYLEAVAYFERAVALLSAGQTQEPKGFVAKARRTLSAIVPVGREEVSSASDRFRLGLLEGRLSEAYGRLANHFEAFQRGERALAHLGRPMPHGPLGLVVGLSVQAGLRALMSTWPDRFEARSAEERAALLEATRIQTRITEACFYTQSSLPMMWSGLAVLNLGEPAGPSATLACGYALMAAVAGIIPLHAMAEAWSRRALELVDIAGTPYDVAFVLQRVCSYRLWMGEWRVAEEGFGRELSIARQVGDHRLLADVMMCMIFTATYKMELRRAEEHFAELNVWVRKTGDAQILCGGRIAEATVMLRLGRTEEAVALCQEARPMADASAPSHDDVRCYGVLALAAWRAGDAQLARTSVERALQVILATRPVAYWTHDGVTFAAEAALAMLEAASAAPPYERAAFEKLADQGVRGAEAFAKVFPIGKPFALLWRGLRHQLAGRPDKARRLWESCRAEAERMSLPYEEGRALLELGRHLPPGHPDRRPLLARASAIFERLSTVPDQQRADEAAAVT
ncbi:Serine/threonine protein kinase [Minicystis rosea]|nr:Serine/threonine protein kinase [Minicystis rosea]